MQNIAVLLCCCFAAALGVNEGAAVASNHSTNALLKVRGRFSLVTFTQLTWLDAAFYCRAHGMQLASIRSDQETTELGEDIRIAGLENESFWTSGTDAAHEGAWVWLSTGSAIAYTNWQSGEPSNSKWDTCHYENCLVLMPGPGLKWNDMPCDHNKYVVCEM